MIDRRTVSNQVRFSGFTRVESIADRQTGPTCGFEAVENIIQLFHPQDDTLAERDLIPRAAHYGFIRPKDDGPSLDVRGYQRLLWDYAIGAQWYLFDHQHVVLPALQLNRGVLVVGDAHCLDRQVYPSRESWHAFVLTNYVTEESGAYILGYVGIDSNFERRETPWAYQSVEAAAAAWAASNVPACSVLVTDQPGRWNSTAQYYRLLRNGQLVPVT